MSFVDVAVGVGLTGFLEAGIGAEAASVVAPMLVGGATSAGMGAATSAITGQDPGKGALIGGLTGAAGGGLGGAFDAFGGGLTALDSAQIAESPEVVSAGEATQAAAAANPARYSQLTAMNDLSGATPATTQIGNAATDVAMSDGPGAYSNIAGTQIGNATTNPAVAINQQVAANGADDVAASAANTVGGQTTPISGLIQDTSGLTEENTTQAYKAATQGPKFLDDPIGWVKNNQVPAAMGALTLGTTAYGMTHPSKYGMPSSSTVNQGSITPYQYDPSKYQPTYPTPNVYTPHYAEGGIAQLADGGMAGTPPNMLDGPADLDFMGNGAFPMSQQNRSYYAAPTQMPTSAQQAMASYEPNTNPLTGEPVAHMARGGIAELAVGGKLLKGNGDGMSDDIKANIAGRQEARLADGEFVVPADVVSHLGNGSTDAGAKHLYAMMDKVRKARTGRKSQGREINPMKYMPA